MLSRPVQLNEYLNRRGVLDDLYKALHKGNTAELVSLARQSMLKTNIMPSLKREVKSEEKSTSFRNDGNKAFKRGTYQKALICYNKALMYAPKSSCAMKLAYSNRSALLLKLKCYSACLSDINTCFEMGCPDDIVEKLNKRKRDATPMQWIECLQESANHTDFAEEFFELDVNCNPQIPSVGTDVGVIVESNIPKIVALNDIKVGSVVAKETAFVSMNYPGNTDVACHYCHKMELNLVPCDECCAVMFCSDFCREMSMIQYHDTECQIIEVVEEVCNGALCRLTFLGALKLRSEFTSWTDFDIASNNVGIDRIKQSSINEIYDVDNKYSILSFKDERHYVDAALFNASFSVAAIIHHMEKVGYFPSAPHEKKFAINALARVMMYLAVYAPPVEIGLTKTIIEKEKMDFSDRYFGLYSFIGKLNHSCYPNVMTVGLGKDLALVAVKPIKKGTELKYSYLGHWLDKQYTGSRNKAMFAMFGKVCNCTLCNGDPNPSFTYQLTDAQKKCYRKLKLKSLENDFCRKSIPEIFPKLVKCLEYLSDVPHSKEYEAVFMLFRKCIKYLQDFDTLNVALD